MKNNIMYPVLIIIFSILLIVAIIQNKNNRKLNNSLEKFVNNNYLSNQEDNLKKNVENNLELTRTFANGDWTYSDTSVDSNYNVSNLMTININDIQDYRTSNNYGTIKFNNNVVYTITFITNEIIVGTHSNTTINIKFLNMFSKDENKINVNPIYEIPNTPTCIVSVIFEGTLILKFASYKVNGAKVSGEVYRIIKAGFYLIDSPPPYYDFKSYDKIVGDYKFAPNLITMNYGVSNSTILDKLTTSYGSQIKFSIRRVFYSPTETDKEIITKNSIPVLLPVVNNNNIPNNIVIAPFSDDKNANSLTSFFKPKATILYFYKLTNFNSDYSFSNPNKLSFNNNVLNLQNGADSFFPKTVYLNDFSSIERKNISTYTMTFVTKVNSNLNDPTIIPFSTLSSIL